jgi:hypothetical protein
MLLSKVQLSPGFNIIARVFRGLTSVVSKLISYISLNAGVLRGIIRNKWPAYDFTNKKN